MKRDKNQTGYIYILTNQGNSVLYIGVTTNLLKRVYQHKRKYLRGFTERYNLNKLVHYEIFIDIANARDRERKIKGWKREKKIDLINTMNPNYKDLYDDLEKDPSALQPQDASLLIGKTIQGGI
jgi:putative endonuclease